MIGLEKTLGYVFKDEELLKKALTHSSYANENKAEGECNERLEFLGDAILGFVVARHLYLTNPGMPEGKMTRLRADMVCEKSLSQVAAILDLGKYLRLGKGEERGGGRQRASILADAVESLLAAVQLDGGTAEAERIIHEYVIVPFEEGKNKNDLDFKTELQEYIQRRPGYTLEYVETNESGPDHDKVFTVAVELNGERVSEGTGKSKKEAEQAAAKLAMARLS